MTRCGLVVLKFDFASVLGFLGSLKILSFTERGHVSQICRLVKFEGRALHVGVRLVE